MDMACFDYRLGRFPYQSIRYDTGKQNIQKSFILYGKPMCLSSLNRGFQTVSSQIQSQMFPSGISLSQPALAPRYFIASSSSFYRFAAATFRSASAAKSKVDVFFSPTPFSKNLVALPAVNASTTEVSDIKPSALIKTPDGSQYAHYSPPPFSHRNLAMYTLTFLLAFSSLPYSPPSFAISSLPEHLPHGHLSRPVSPPFSSVKETAPSSTPLPTTLAVLNLPWSNLSVSRLQNGKSGEVKVVSEEGNCATCLGDVDGTLGACSAAANCVSTFDDRGSFFVAPWEFEGEVSSAKATLRAAIEKMGGEVVVDQDRYMRATFSDKKTPTDDVEFLFTDPILDRTVTLRSASRSAETGDRGRNAKRLEKLRAEVTWQQVPILRNRQRKFVFIETPWDTFGPEPPPTFDYSQRLESAPDAD